MITHEQVLQALKKVVDPELRQDVVTLGMVGEVDITEAGAVEVEIILTTPGCPLKASFQEQLRDTVGRIEGVTSVSARFGAMDQAQREALRGRLDDGRQKRSPGISLPDTCRVIAVTSGKGGVGKSTLTANLALAMAQRGHEVGVMDADVYGYSIPQMFGLSQRPVTVDRMIVPPVAHGVRLMSIGFFLDDDAAVMWRGPMLHRALEQFLGDVHWGEIDYLFIDMPPGTGDVAISLGQLLPRAEALVVTTPQAAAQTVARRAALSALKMDQHVLGIVENMSGRAGEPSIFGAGGGQLLADELQVPLMGQLPLDPAVREGGDAGTPVVATDAPVAAEIGRIADAIEARRPKRVTPPPSPADRIKKPLSLL